MPLESPLFAGDRELEACQVDNAHHIAPGARGDHVFKVQQALVALGFPVDGGERAKKTYGRSTARAVLKFKEEWDIINRSYEATADDIVGKMTITELDDAMRSHVYFTLPPPPIVFQSDIYWCWAAALESWLTVSPRPTFDQNQLMTMFKPWTDPANGGLRPPGWGAVASRFNLEATQFVPGAGLTAEFLKARLKRNGFLIIVYNTKPGGPAHTNVIFGVRVHSRGSFVRAMDPFFSGQTLEFPLSHYTSHDFVGVLWSND